MVATTDQKARLLDLTTGVLELVRDGKRDIGMVCNALQRIKDHPNSMAVHVPLKHVGTVTIPRITEPFVVHEKFVRNIEDGSLVRISYVENTFWVWFGGMTVWPVPETVLRYSELTGNSVHGLILAELGDRAETTLSQIYWLMTCQPNGEEGVLLTGGWANIFYVDGRAVRVGWRERGGGWTVSAHSVVGPIGWGGERRVFSRNS